ncbi:FtsX-like permease family protein [Paracoccus sp. (in: a-proteobacteria)]|uniref:FtsX-like permease family protein n=1 Tax=Paracoccus sp. TaxID=267 RepID=UPI0026DEEE30|nr:FtsX-like permease family protein [Paracoccus sp. (in: a-proteobacteria)]MDO5646614.1 FtsX-like permease family protein [Paracoccus sp. (in: a-proteobacteria)]
MTDWWRGLSATSQDALILLAILLPALMLGVLVCRGFSLRVLLRGLLLRYLWTNAAFVVLVALSVGLGVGLIAQERGLRQASARIAEKFDLIIAAPGDEVSMLMATVYLQPTAAPLLDGAVYERVQNAPGVRFITPLAYGDSWGDSPIIGSTADFVAHLSGDLDDGRIFARDGEAVIGARVPLDLGATFEPAHGHGATAEHGAHDGVQITVTGRMAPTGSPWDRAIIVPVETVWLTHGFGDGHAEQDTHLGPPFAPEFFPGTPAILVVTRDLGAAYGLRAQFSTDQTMAFFPGAVLTRLHGLMGDVRQIMSVMSLGTQVLVAAAVMTGLIVLARLFARRLALLRALGAPGRMVFALVWSYAAVLLGLGTVLGLAVGLVATRAISTVLTARTDLLITPRLGWPELHLTAACFSLALIVALAPAVVALMRPVTDDLRK